MCNCTQSCAKGHKDTCSYVMVRTGAWLCVVMCDASHWDFGALPPGKLPNRDDRHAIRYSSPMINEDAYEHHLMLSMGIHVPLSL